MAVTLTPRFGEPQWGAGSDSPGRSIFNGAFLTIDQKAAYDDGSNPTVVPTSDVVAGRYSHLVNGTTRQLMRRSAAGWQQVGGNTWAEPQYEVASVALTTSSTARQRSHASLATPTVVETWDGSVTRGGRFAVGDVNASIPSAVHVGDTASAVDLTNLGRVYARATAVGHRAIVASAFADTAGPLFTARTVGGDAWTVDAQGRMRAQVPTAFGAGVLTAGVPLSVAPSGTDNSGADFYAVAGKPATRWFRAAGDGAAIASVAQDQITLGRSSWAGARVDLIAPNVGVTGALGVTGSAVISAGLTVQGSATVQGSTTLAGLSAGATTVSTLQASSTVTFLGDLYLSGRLDLPTNKPTGTSAGQIRIGSDWAIETYDGGSWRGRFGAGGNAWKHAWTGSGGSVPGNDVYIQVASSLSAVSPNGTVASLSSGELYLNAPGLWSLTWSFYNDSPFDGDNRMEIRWTNGAFPGRDSMRDVRTRQSGGLAGAGSGECNTTWTGYVTSGQAQQAIEMWVAQKGGSANNASTATGFYVTAEYLSA